MGWANGNHGSDAVVKREDRENPRKVGRLEVPKWDVVHATLAGRLAGGSTTRTVTIGQTEVQVAVREWRCPAATADLVEGDIIEISAGENAGVFLRVVEATWEDQVTERRIPVVEEQKPQGWDVTDGGS